MKRPPGTESLDLRRGGGQEPQLEKGLVGRQAERFTKKLVSS